MKLYVGEDGMDSPRLAEHGTEGESEANAQNPRSGLGGDTVNMDIHVHVYHYSHSMPRLGLSKTLKS